MTYASPARSATIAPLPYCPSKRITAWLSGTACAFTEALIALTAWRSSPRFSPLPAPELPQNVPSRLPGVSLENGRARPDHFPPLAPGIARSTHLLQPTRCGGQIRCAGQSALAGSLSRAINIAHHGASSAPIPQSARLLLPLQRSGHEVFEKQGAQSLDRSLIQSGKEAGECRARGLAIAAEECHERFGKRLHTLIEGFQRAFEASRIPYEDRHKVDDLIVSEATTGKAYSLFYGRKDTLAFQNMRDHDHFPEPAGQGRSRLRRGLVTSRKIGDPTQ